MTDATQPKMVSVRLDTTHTNALKALAKLWGLSRSDALRRVILEAHAKSDPKGKPRRRE